MQSLFKDFPASERDGYAARMQGLGLRLGRMDASWAATEPTAPVDGVRKYDWRRNDTVVLTLARRGVRLLPVVVATPRWASKDGRSGNVPPAPARFDDFAAYAAAFAERYGPGGTFWAAHPEVPARPISVYEIWNEENSETFWAGRDARAFGEMFVKVRRAIRGRQPQAQVMIGSLLYAHAGTTSPKTFLKTMYEVPGMDAEILGVHPYGGTSLGVVANLRQFHEALAAVGRPDMPKWNTEMGWPIAVNGFAPAARYTEGPTSDEARAGKIAVMSDAQLASNCNVEHIDVYGLTEPNDGKQDLPEFQGLLDRDTTYLSAQAYGDAQARLDAQEEDPPKLNLCGDPSAPSAVPLPLSLRLRRTSTTCWQAEVTYRGFPVEESTVRFNAADGSTPGEFLTDAFGRQSTCTRTATTMTATAELSYVYASVPRFALSTPLTCRQADPPECGGASRPDTLLVSGPTGTVASADATFAFQSPQRGVTFQCQLDAGAWTACDSPRSYAALAEGAHVFRVRAVDGAGAEDRSPATRRWTIDTVAPGTTITSGPPSTTSSSAADFGFAADEADSRFECRRDGDAWTGCTSPTALSGLGDGEHRFEVRAIDAAGNVDASPAAYSWTVDTSPGEGPDAAITAGPTGLTRSTSAGFEFTLSGADGAECRLDRAAWARCASPTAFADLAQGEHVFEVRGLRGATVDPTPASRTWTVDTVAPGATIATGPSGTTAEATATFGLTASEADVRFECRLDDGGWTLCGPTVSYPDLADGQHAFAARATDAAGNVGAPAVRTWTVARSGGVTPTPSPGPTSTPTRDPTATPGAAATPGPAGTPGTGPGTAGAGDVLGTTAKPACAGVRLAVGSQPLAAVRRSGLRARLLKPGAGPCGARITVRLSRSVQRRLGLGRRVVPVAKLDRVLNRPATAVTVRLSRRAQRATRRVRTLRLSVRVVLTEAGRRPTTLTVTRHLRR